MSSSSSTSELSVPLSDVACAELFAPFAPLIGKGAVLAVSGGSDSMALMHLFARARLAKAVPHAPVHVVTIDHGLRSGSAADAAFVAEAARSAGFTAHVRRWEGHKPASGRAAAARDARYRLLADVMREVGAGLLLTAHTADDQAETLLMRLARGSGIDGLSGMAPLRRLCAGEDLWLGRPLLKVEKDRLVAHLRASGIAWREDPTNADATYERPRLRQARAALASLGLTTANLALSAKRARQASEALDAEAAAVFAGPAVRVDPLGLVEISVPALLARPVEIGQRVLKRGLSIAGGAEAPIPLAALETLYAAVAAGGGHGSTLGRAALRRRADRLLIEREPGREPLSTLPLQPGLALTWDGRFRIDVVRGLDGIAVGPLGAAGLARLDAQDVPRPPVPARTLRALPAIYRDEALIAVPLLAYVADPALQLDIRMSLLGAPPIAGSTGTG